MSSCALNRRAYASKNAVGASSGSAFTISAPAIAAANIEQEISSAELNNRGIYNSCASVIVSAIGSSGVNFWFIECPFSSRVVVLYDAVLRSGRHPHRNQEVEFFEKEARDLAKIFSEEPD